MKLSNETKVGLLAIVSILILVLGFNFLKGKSLFSKTPVLFAEFSNIGALEKSNAVKINGLPVGTVYSMNPKDKEVNKIVVEIHLSRDVSIPENSIAFIDGPLVGGSFINITKGDANQYLASGDTISTRLDEGLMSDIKAQVTPTITRVNETLDSLKITIGSMNDIFDPNTRNNLRTLIAQLTISSAHLQQMLNAQNGLLAQSLGNINSVTANLARNNDAVTSSIRNVEVMTSKLANANIDGTVAALQGTIEELRSTISNINTNKGTLGMLMNDRALYDRLDGMASRLNTVALSAEILFDDIRLHPKRYVNISVFGGKNKGEPLTSPLVKDTIPVRQ
ncbi:MAG TPA: MlaD family protein [Flavisolibacter sp.]|nr:MlaD family protein [Flavisolibacter sp.]